MKLKPFKVDTLGRNVKLLEVMNKFDHQFRLHSLDLNEEYSFFQSVVYFARVIHSQTGSLICLEELEKESPGG